MYNALDFTYVLYFAGGMCIINKNNMFHSFFQAGKSHFSADFQAQDGVHIIQECTLFNPNDGTMYKVNTDQKAFNFLHSDTCMLGSH